MIENNRFAITRHVSRYKSVPYKIMPEHTDVKLRLQGKHSYEFRLDSHVTLALFADKMTVVPPELCILSFEYICPEYLDRISLSVGHRLKYFKAARNIVPCTKWTKFSIDISDGQYLAQLGFILSLLPSIRLRIDPFPLIDSTTFRIRNICLRVPTPEELEKQEHPSKPVSPVRNGYGNDPHLYDRSCPCAITEVDATDDRITLSADATHIKGEVFLCEIPMYTDFSGMEYIVRDDAVVSRGKGGLSFSVPRFSGRDGLTYDSVYSRWALAVQLGDALWICSNLRYADQIGGKTQCSFPALIPKNKKGLGDFTLNRFESDLDELGISHISVNIRVNDFLRMTPGADTMAFEYAGRTYYADKNTVGEYDAVLRSAARRDIVVSAIVLVYPESKSIDKAVGRMMEHPDYQPSGAYSMPNMTTPEALNLYAASIDFLAERYNRPDGQFGRIHRWIVHNEVDAGGVWTNVGDKKLGEFMEIYVKSMRLVYYTTRKYDADSEVFISLTHFWKGMNPEPNCYPGADTLEMLLDYTEAEGDFKWGIACHPYPEMLWEPKSWFDPTATFDRQTDMITFKNLEVMDDWIRQPRTFYRGAEKRTLLLSEQNPNSLDYSERALADQAAGLAYAWKKTEACTGIDAYIAHSWIDARFEGGLKTGLRRYPDDAIDPYGKKPSWFVFRDAGTPDEDAAFLFAKSMLHIAEWDEILQFDLTDGAQDEDVDDEDEAVYTDARRKESN